MKNSKLVTNKLTEFRRIHKGRISTKIENISTQLKTTITYLKTYIKGFNSRLDEAVERISHWKTG